mmetsp:Transcript_74449/g.155203  ORF Transcript_74449/g.155203 Transcript_74449/m.155203 type:complete len:580 (+) Transcript_74449:116-1855(+)
MDVDIDNFSEAFEIMRANMETTVYVAVDVEMTGITGGPGETKVAPGDAPQAQYHKGRSIVNGGYQIVQVGVSLFQEIAPNHFVARPFNFFVFPHPFHEHSGEQQSVKREDIYMGMSVSSILFLAKSGLDFNRWVRKGISYVRSDEEEKLLKLLDDDEPIEAEKGPPPMRPQDVTFIRETLSKVQAIVDNGQEEMKLPNMARHIAVAMRQRIAERFPQTIVEKRNSGPGGWEERWVLNPTKEKRTLLERRRKRKLLDLIGFRQVWNLLRQARRPLVCHNGFYDLLFLYNSFEAPLPESLGQFKLAMHKAFPHVFDTKILAESEGLNKMLAVRRSSLVELATSLQNLLERERNLRQQQQSAMETEGGEAAESHKKLPAELKFDLPPGFTAYENSENAFHTAGYDAFQTGRLFGFYKKRVGDFAVLKFTNLFPLLQSPFLLCLTGEERLIHDGVARFVYGIDLSSLTSRGFLELLKPLTKDGRRQVVFKWCSDQRSMILVLHGCPDIMPDTEGREVFERQLDEILQGQVLKNRLKFHRWDAFMSMLTGPLMSAPAKAAAEGKGGDVGGGGGGGHGIKRPRFN